MDVTVRRLLPAEIEQAVRVEEAAMKGHGYLRDVSHLFFYDEEGPMLGAFHGEELVGVAKYTVLPDRTAWLETLRVSPEHQRKGVGRQMYEVFVRLSHQLGVESMAMYTGLANIPSASLARLFGLETAGKYREFQLDLAGKKPETEAVGFEAVGEEEGCALLESLCEKYEHFIVFNRTFMHMDYPILCALAREGKVLLDRSDGSFMAFGNRFLERRSVQIAAMAGNYQKCMDYALRIGLERGVPQVVAMAPLDDEALQSALEAYGFHAAADLQVMSGPVRSNRSE